MIELPVREDSVGRLRKGANSAFQMVMKMFKGT
jgi:hypothetical protein